MYRRGGGACGLLMCRERDYNAGILFTAKWIARVALWSFGLGWGQNMIAVKVGLGSHCSDVGWGRMSVQSDMLAAL